MIDQFVLWMTLTSLPTRILSASDTEGTMTSTWLTGNWSDAKAEQEIVTRDEDTGCICRLKPDHHMVCYGATSCSSFPRQIRLPPGLSDFRLKNTIIRKFSAGELFAFRGLRRLDLDANFGLSVIEPGFFAGMSRLVNLSVSFNTNLTVLHRDTFTGLIGLKRLKLIKNGFRNILDATRALGLSVVPSLKSLSLSENVFRVIGEDAFVGLTGTRVTELDLVLCQIERIHPRSLSIFAGLEKLRLGENILGEDQLEELFDNMAADGIPVRLLNLYELGLRKGNRLTELLLVVARLNVTHLNLRRNHIENVYEGLFPAMPHLRTLDLREISALDVEPNALNQRLMPRLETLLLGGNRLSGVVPGVLLPQLSELDLSANAGTDVLPSYFDVNTNIFANMTRLTSLNLSFNRIAAISNATFHGVRTLRILGLKNATVFHIAVNSFQTLRDLFLLNLEDNPFKPFNTFPEPIFDGLPRLEILLLSNCAITHFTRADIFDSLLRLKYLNLRGNHLARVDSNLFRPLPALTHLDLSHNLLTPWDDPRGLFASNPNLEIVSLARNRFTYLTDAMMHDLSSITRLDVSGNPYVCDDFLRDGILSRPRNLTDDAVCLSPDEWRDKPLTEFLSSVRIPQTHNLETYLALIVLSSVILFTAAVLLIRYRWHFRYWLFLAKMAYLRRCHQRSRSDPSRYKYDAFVSYSHEDRNFVVRLVSELENAEPYLKLCVYERDFEIGSVISETVMEHVDASRRVVFVVSDSFARSQWCIWELQIAEYHRVFFRLNRYDDSLIMIKLEPLVKSVVTPILKYMLRTRIYLEWSQDLKKQKMFWEKLRRCLSRCPTSNSNRDRTERTIHAADDSYTPTD